MSFLSLEIEISVIETNGGPSPMICLPWLWDMIVRLPVVGLTLTIVPWPKLPTIISLSPFSASGLMTTSTERGSL